MDGVDTAGQITDFVHRLLTDGGHVCDMAIRGTYLADQAAVVCGCGVVVELPRTPGGQVGGTVAYDPADPIASTLALIDPTEVYTPELVEQHILDVLSRLETGALFERQAIERWSRAQAAWEERYFRTYHASAERSEGKRKAAAMVACDIAGLTQERWESKMVKDAVAATMHNLRSVLSGYQSVAKSITAAYNPGGSAGRF